MESNAHAKADASSLLGGVTTDGAFCTHLPLITLSPAVAFRLSLLRQWRILLWKLVPANTFIEFRRTF